MRLLVWLGGWSETRKHSTQCPACGQEVLPHRAAEAPVVCLGSCPGEDGHPGEAGVCRTAQRGCLGMPCTGGAGEQLREKVRWQPQKEAAQP